MPCGDRYWHLLETEDTSFGFEGLGWSRTRTVESPWVGFWCDGLDYAAWATRCKSMQKVVTDQVDRLASPDAMGEAIPEAMGEELAKLTSLTEGIPPPGEMQDCRADTLALVDLGKRWCCLLEMVIDYAEEQDIPTTVPAKPSDLPKPGSSGSKNGLGWALFIIAIVYLVSQRKGNS